jgi:hypothetical protein
MSYANLAAPALPILRLPFETLRTCRTVALFIIQSAGVAAILWAVLAMPGLVTDHDSAGVHVRIASHR